MSSASSKSKTGLERLRRSRIAVWGTGTEGLAVAQSALERDATVVFVDDRALDVNNVEVAGQSLEVRSPSVLDQGRFDYVVRSPGVSVYRSELKKARESGCQITSATAMWLEDFSGDRVIAVTGTKGKTTTAWLTAKILEACDQRVRLGGNMGTPLTALYGEQQPCDVYVIEVSSFQAADVTVSPRIGVLTLLAPDHLDWHGTYDNYVRDKLNLFDHRNDLSLAVASPSTDAAKYTERFSRRTLYGGEDRIRTGPQGVTVDGETVLDIGSACSYEALRGEHNLLNLCGALSACGLAGAEIPSQPKLMQALEKMPILASRLQTVARTGNIEYVNDALASNPAGTIAALRTFAGRPISLIVGGHDRGVDLGPLVKEIHCIKPEPSIVFLPELGERLKSELQGSIEREASVTSLREAVTRATAMVGTESEAVVLFSPASPTPALEGTYIQRGAAFNEAVAEMTGSNP